MCPSKQSWDFPTFFEKCVRVHVSPNGVAEKNNLTISYKAKIQILKENMQILKFVWFQSLFWHLSEF